MTKAAAYLVESLMRHAPQLSFASQHSMQRFLCSYNPTLEHLPAMLSNWVQFDHHVASLVPCNAKGVSPTVVVPLLIWAHAQPWYEDVLISKVFEKWNAPFCDAAHSNALLNCRQLLVDMGDALRVIPDHSLPESAVKFVRNTVYRACQKADDYNSKSVPKNPEAPEYAAVLDAKSRLMIEMGRLLCSKDLAPWIRTMARFEVNLGLRHEWAEMPMHMGEYSGLMVLNSDLSADAKSHLCTRMSAQMWGIHRLYQKIKPLLPSDVVARAQLIPWLNAGSKGTAEYAMLTNVALCTTYLPEIAPLMEFKDNTQTTWSNAKKLHVLLNDCLNTQRDPQLPLPQNFAPLEMP